ncbi:hypothetical protein E1264_14095 [Actinomadura sp. KC216]|uniref:hypothetical protein n=1 Tax=Actinomadura sp. KC216 TaxID=2530370 RepID=UPI00104F4B60|nr:hypothetical protein [Actinomadura sp. KC216]TDB87611.1 hypothetical protein E1264_14095 [Actinomadura sp. KC216]
MSESMYSRERSTGKFKYRWQSDFAKGHVSRGVGVGLSKGFERGKARGMAKGLLMVLEARGLEVSFQLREQVLSCTDVELLGRCAKRVGAIGTAEELFD